MIKFVTYNQLLNYHYIGRDYPACYLLDKESEDDYHAFYPDPSRRIDYPRMLAGHNVSYSFWREHNPDKIATLDMIYEGQDIAFQKLYVDKIVYGEDVHVFVLVSYQVPGFEARMKRYGLDKYIKHRSMKAMNHNYPERKDVNCLQIFIMDYREQA